MKTMQRAAVLAGLVLGLGVVAWGAEDSVGKLKPEAETTLERFKKADTGLAKRLESAAGYAVFPRIGKGGLVLGGAHGNGLVYEQGRLVGTAKMSQVTIGAQIGGQSFAELVLFENAAVLAQFKESRFEMTAQAGAVAAAEGLAENARYTDGVLIFTLPNKGLMAEASVGGQKFKFEAVKE